MIKIKLLERDLHRNETTFRPFVFAKDILKDVGLEFTDSDDYDYVWVGQASIIDKETTLEKSIEKGIGFISKITGDYMIIDGQDSHGLIGTIDVFRESSACLFLKNSYLRDFNLYKKGSVNGRIYWGDGDYSVPDIDELKSKIKLSGCNWLGTIQPQWFDYSQNKEYDVSCMFGRGKKNLEYLNNIGYPYSKHREILLDTIDSKYKKANLVNGERVPQDVYYNKMYNSKIIIAPLGYGAMAPRDIESAAFGSVLIKPDMSFIDSKPFIYEDGETYVACKYDWSDLNEKIDYVLTNYKELQPMFVENMRKRFTEEYSYEKLALHLYGIFKNLEGVSFDKN
tara:strand:+ start:287 stop:1303 length:1017 start_codon:yes stop_codon:yes gene_type:complete